MKKFCLAVIVLSLGCLSVAETLHINNNPEQLAKSAKVSPNSPDAICSFNFSSGSDNTALSYCVSANGNVMQIVTPAGQQHVFTREGYSFCDINANTQYVDYADAGATDNWQSATTLNHNLNSVKIARTTSDGIWSLTQTIMQVPASSSIKVTMALKNNTAVSREVQLVRFADIDATGVIPNTIDSTINDAMIYQSIGRGTPYGLALQNVGTSPFTYLGYVQDTDTGVAPCSPFTHKASGPLTGIDGSAVMTYVITIPAHATKTVTVGYRGL